MKARNQSLDILRGIGILLMVFDHVDWGTIVRTYVQSFHMPLFFIVSGFLWKNEDFRSLAKKRFMTLMVPYFVFSAFYLLLQHIIPLFNTGNGFINSLRSVFLFPTDFDNFPIAPALWFLPCMFFSSIVYSLLSRLKWKAKTAAIGGILIIGMIYSSVSEVMLPFTLEPLMVAIAFMLTGEYIRRYENDVIKWIDKYWIILILFFTEVALAICNGFVDLRSARYHNCVLFFVNGILGTLAYWGIARKIDEYSAKIPMEGVQHISFLSKNAMGFICLNQFFIRLMKTLFELFMPDRGLFSIIRRAGIFTSVMIIIMCITKLIMDSRFKFVLGRRS